MRKCSNIIGYTGSLELPWTDNMSGHGHIYNLLAKKCPYEFTEINLQRTGIV